MSNEQPDKKNINHLEEDDEVEDIVEDHEMDNSYEG